MAASSTTSSKCPIQRRRNIAYRKKYERLLSEGNRVETDVVGTRRGLGVGEGNQWFMGRRPVEITEDGLRFEANKLNAALNENAESVWIPMSSIRSVALGPSLITKVITVGHANGDFRFRCFGAKGVVEELKRHLASR